MAKATQLKDADYICELFDRAAEANVATGLRSGSLINLPGKGNLVVAGDLHDHADNYERVIRLARLNASPENYLVLQELVHGDELQDEMDFSYRILARAAELKLKFPDQVFHIQSNHELAQRFGDGIVKGSVSVCDAFDDALDWVFKGDASRVAQSIGRYIETLPMAVRSANGLFCAHSLPSPRDREMFDPRVINRKPAKGDLMGPEGSVYLMVWGRRLTQKYANELADKWKTKLFILGHQPTEHGYESVGQTILVINSDHELGVALKLDLAREYTRDELVDHLVQLADVRI